MDYYQGVVVEYLRTDRNVFVNTEYCIQLNEGPHPRAPFWYCDAVAVNFSAKAVYLCEVSYSKSLAPLLKRLAAWDKHWVQVTASLARDSNFGSGWSFRPWLFIPAESRVIASDWMKRLNVAIGGHRSMPDPKITTLESVAPWKYPYNWKHEPDDNPTTD